IDLLLIQELNTPDQWVIKLFVNDYTPDADTASVDLTEATFTGYSAKNIVRSSWGSPTTEGGKAKSTYGAPFSYTMGSTGGSIYGYWVEDSSGTVLWAERFAVPRAIVDGDILNVSVS